MKMVNSEMTGFGKEVGLVHKAIVTGRKFNAGKSFWTRLADDEKFFADVMALYETRLAKDEEDLAKDEEDLGKFPVELLEDVGFHREGWAYVELHEMVQRAIALKGKLGCDNARWLEKNQHLIPESLRGKELVFGGDLTYKGYSYMDVLHYRDGHWERSGSVFYDGFIKGYFPGVNRNYRLVCLRKAV